MKCRLTGPQHHHPLRIQNVLNGWKAPRRIELRDELEDAFGNNGFQGSGVRIQGADVDSGCVRQKIRVAAGEVDRRGADRNDDVQV